MRNGHWESKLSSCPLHSLGTRQCLLPCVAHKSTAGPQTGTDWVLGRSCPFQPQTWFISLFVAFNAQIRRTWLAYLTDSRLTAREREQSCFYSSLSCLTLSSAIIPHRVTSGLSTPPWHCLTSFLKRHPKISPPPTVLNTFISVIPQKLFHI